MRAYDGLLAGLCGGELVGDRPEREWTFEGVSYETPADESAVLEGVSEGLTEPSDAEIARARGYVFGAGGFTHTGQALLAVLVAYEAECEGGEGVEAVAAILREAARRIAVIEALTI